MKNDSFIWQLIERTGNAIVLFIIGIVVARVIGPQEYGVISLTVIFITFSDILVNCGLGAALIQKENPSQYDYNLAFTVTTIIAVIITLLLIIAAPFIAEFYREDKIKLMMYIYSAGIWPFAIYGLIRSSIMKRMNFKIPCLAAIVSLSLSCMLCIFLVLNGAGVYSMAIQSVTGSILGLIILWSYNPTSFRIVLNISKGHSLLKYGYKMMLSNIIDASYKSLPTACIPRVFGSEILGLFTYGRQIPNVIITTIHSALNAYLFPVFSKEQNNLPVLKQTLRDSMTIYMFFMFPIMFAITALSEEIILLLLGPVWIGTSFYLSIFSIVYILLPVQNINFQAVAALGKSNTYLRYEVYKKTLGTGVFIFSLFYDIETVMYLQVFIAIAFIIIGIYPNIKYLKYTLSEQFMDMWPALLSAIIMATSIRLFSFSIDTEFLIVNIFAKSIIAFLVYIISTLLFNRTTLLRQIIPLLYIFYRKFKEKSFYNL